MTQRTYEQAVLAALPGTIPQIMQKSGVGRATVYLWLNRLRKLAKVFIKSWRRTTGQSTPFYVIGQGIDAPRPKARTGADYSRRHYVKHRRDLDKELRASKKAALANAASTRTKPQSWLSALGVAA